MKTDRHVLIIDDDQDFVHLMSVYLKGSGYRTSMVTDGMQGHRFARTERPDVILIDTDVRRCDVQLVILLHHDQRACVNPRGPDEQDDDSGAPVSTVRESGRFGASLC